MLERKKVLAWAASADPLPKTMQLKTLDGEWKIYSEK